MESDFGKKLLLIGGGGHCHSVLDSILSLGAYNEIGIIDYVDSSYPGIPVVGTDDDIPMLKKAGWTDAFITVGSVGNTELRRKLYAMVKGIGMKIPTIIDPSAIVSRKTELAGGIYIGKRAVINAGSSVGTCAIINTGVIIEHDCSIGDFSHVSPGTTVCGHVCIGNDSHVGAGSVVRQQISIGNSVLIGAGSVVVKDIPDNSVAVGNPARVIKIINSH